MEAAKASAYALTVQLSASTPAPSSWCRGWQRRRHDERVESYGNEANEPGTKISAARSATVGSSADCTHD